MTVFPIGTYTLHITPFYEKRLGLLQINNIVAMLGKIQIPVEDIGIICLDHSILEEGLLLFVALYNTTDERVEEMEAEIHLYNGEGEKVASGLIHEGGLPTLAPRDIYVWHFLLPKAAFLVSDVKLGLYRLEVISKTEGTAERVYSFSHIMAKAKDHPDDVRARVTLLNTSVDYLTEIDLEQWTEKESNKKRKE